MKSFLSFVNAKLPYTAVAIGKFDGMHKAHIALLNMIKENGMALSIAQVIPPFITPPNKRGQYLEIPFYRLRFDIIKGYSPLEFLNLLFFVMPNLNKIAVGYDFCFGKNRACSASDLPHLLSSINKSNVDVIVLESKLYKNVPIHTSRIKELIAQGDLENANAMLDRFYTMQGRLIKGQGLGSKKLYPTLNIKTTLYVLPKDGVYAGFCKVNNRIYKAAIFIGHRLSTDKNFCIECHVIESFNELTNYGDRIEILFLKRIRDNKRFDSLEALKTQIKRDIGDINAVLDSI